MGFGGRHGCGSSFGAKIRTMVLNFSIFFWREGRWFLFFSPYFKRVDGSYGS